jgi:hypothetical protein
MRTNLILRVKNYLKPPKTTQEKLNSLSWDQDPSHEQKRLLILHEINSRIAKTSCSIKVHETDSMYYHTVIRYKLGYVFSHSDPIHGTDIGNNQRMQPISEQHRLESELDILKLRKKIKEEFGLDLHELAADPKFK